MTSIPILMLHRLQRIAAGIELFALVLWTGGLFFLIVLTKPLFDHQMIIAPEMAKRVYLGLVCKFSAIEVIFALALVASNFLKYMVFRGIYELKAVALMISAIMLAFAFYGAVYLKPAVEEKRAELAASTTAPVPPDHIKELDTLRKRWEAVMYIDLALGLFMVYSYRSFEERKLQALARIIKMP